MTRVLLSFLSAGAAAARLAETGRARRLGTDVRATGFNETGRGRRRLESLGSKRTADLRSTDDKSSKVLESPRKSSKLLSTDDEGSKRRTADLRSTDDKSSKLLSTDDEGSTRQTAYFRRRLDDAPTRRTAYLLSTDFRSPRTRSSTRVLEDVGFEVALARPVPHKNRVLSNKLSMTKIYEKIAGRQTWSYVFENDIAIVQNITLDEIVEYERVAREVMYGGRVVNRSGQRRRRGCDVDIPSRRVAAPPRPRRGYSVETSRGAAAAAT